MDTQQVALRRSSLDSLANTIMLYHANISILLAHQRAKSACLCTTPEPGKRQQYPIVMFNCIAEQLTEHLKFSATVRLKNGLELGLENRFVT